MAKAEMTVHVADLPAVKALVEQLRVENERLRDALRAIHYGAEAMVATPLASLAMNIESIARHALRKEPSDGR